MNLIPWRNRREASEFLPLSMLRSEMDTLMDRFFNGSFLSSWAPSSTLSAWSPTLDMKETDNEFILKVETPGVKPKDVNISLRGNTLRIEGEKKEEETKESEGVRYSERRFGSFLRTIDLPEEVDKDKINAKQENGVLAIHLTKVKGDAPKKIPVA